MSDEAEVSYTVKELLSQLNSRIDAFMTLLGSKADQSAVAHLSERVDVHENRLSTLEHDGKAKDAHRSAAQEFRRWIVPTALTLVMVGVMVWQAVHP